MSDANLRGPGIRPSAPAFPGVLTLTPFFPSEQDDARGCFIAESHGALREIGIENRVFAVQPFYRGKVLAHRHAHPASMQRFFCVPGGVGLPSAGAFLYSSLLARIRELHHRKPIQLIHAHAALPCGHAAMLLSRKLGIPFVVTVHGLDAFLTNQVKGLAGRWCRKVCAQVYRSACRVICISKRVEQEVLASSTVATRVIYNGVDASVFVPDPVGENRQVVLSVGNLIPIKGHALLLEALARLTNDFPQASCELIGDGPELPRLRDLTLRLQIADRVQFLGRQSRLVVAQAMRRCAVFALPSRYEGLGCVYLEAMASGKPAIACRGQGIEEIIQHGNNGWLVEQGNLRELTEVLSQLLRDSGLRARIGAEARAAILARFTLAHQAQATAELYRSCLA